MCEIVVRYIDAVGAEQGWSRDIVHREALNV